MYVFWLIIFTLFGFIFGSFGNVVVWRLPKGDSLSIPGSHCPLCKEPIKAWQNVPVISYMLLGGKCHKCSATISLRYPLVELFTAVLFGLAFLISSNLIQALVVSFLLYILLLLSLIDIDTHRLPNSLVACLGAVGLTGMLLSYVPLNESFLVEPLIPSIAKSSFWVLPLFGADGNMSPFASAAFGLLIGTVPVLLFSVLYFIVRKKVGFGMGDIKLIAALGPFLGIASLAVLPVASLVGLIFILSRGKTIDSATKIPFGPFIAMATIFILLLGLPLNEWYLGFML